MRVYKANKTLMHLGVMLKIVLDEKTVEKTKMMIYNEYDFNI